MNMEIWVSVNGYKNYEVSNFGNVRNLTTGKLLRISNFKAGRRYKRVCLDKKPFLLHRIVLCSFENKGLQFPMEVMHLDNDGYNNVLDNLGFGTHAENMKLDRGNNHSFRGEENKNAKLNEVSVKTIKIAYLNRTSFHWGRKKLAKIYGITEAQVGRIALSKIGGWAHVN